MPRSNGTGPELYFGLVAPLGVGGGTLSWALEQALGAVHYATREVHIAGLLRNVSPVDPDPTNPLQAQALYSNDFQRYSGSINAGNHLCKKLGGINDDEVSPDARGQDALVALAIDEITRIRSATFARAEQAYEPLPRTAFVIRSWKRPGEVDRCRSVYGESFLLVSAHLSRDTRVDRLARKLATSDLDFFPDRARDKAESLINIDESEDVGYGQDVRHTYSKADLFVDAGRSPAEIVATLTRFVEALFNFQFHTPTVDEQGMAIAQLASLRSSHLTRQVGAAITTADGSLVAVGCNEVPKYPGGAYWWGDEPDSRDFQKRKNVSLEVRREILGDTLERLGKAEWLRAEVWDAFQRNPQAFLDRARDEKLLMQARVMDAIEYDRSVHAEMLAITDAARRGVSVSGCTLYTTTFPCHNCARHIVASGISRVVYIHPYEKSLTKRLHDDAVAVDCEHGQSGQRVRFEPFVGISPNLYFQLFGMGRRRGDGERWMRIAKFDRESAQPRIVLDRETIARNENKAVQWLAKRLEETGLRMQRKEADT